MVRTAAQRVQEYLRDPKTGAALVLEDDAYVSADGRRFPIINGA
jgi:hypothetical protein